MIKIYFNRVIAIIANAQETALIQSQQKYRDARILDVDKGFSSIKFYLSHAHSRKRTFVLRHPAPSEIMKQFLEEFDLVEAAGGIVFNEAGEILMIYRRGCWDFPKGKIDPGEDAAAAALREVSEETGLKQLEIKCKQSFDDLEQEGTYHIYQQDGGHVLKLTHWFEMSGTKADQLVPEKREGIERAKWIVPMYLPAYLDNTFLSVRDLAFRYC